MEDWEARSTLYRLMSGMEQLGAPCSPVAGAGLLSPAAALFSPAPGGGAGGGAPPSMPPGEVHMDEIDLIECIGKGGYGWARRGAGRCGPLGEEQPLRSLSPLLAAALLPCFWAALRRALQRFTPDLLRCRPRAAPVLAHHVCAAACTRPAGGARAWPSSTSRWARQPVLVLGCQIPVGVPGTNPCCLMQLASVVSLPPPMQCPTDDSDSLGRAIREVGRCWEGGLPGGGNLRPCGAVNPCMRSIP